MRGTCDDDLLHRQRDQPCSERIAGLRNGRLAVVALDQRAMRIQHATHRMQRLHFATGCEELIQLRHRERRLIDCAEDQRRIRFGVDAREHLDDLRDALDLHIHADPHRCLVVGLRKRIDQAHLSMAASIGIGWRPALAVRLGHGDRRIVEHGRKRILAGLCERQQVHERLEQRTDRALRIERAIESRLGRIATADDRKHVTIAHVGDHEAAFERWAFLALRLVERGLQCLFGIDLRGGIERAVDDQPGALEAVGRIVGLQLPTHQVHESRVAVGDDARMRADAERRGLRAIGFGGGDQTRFDELAKHHVAALQRTIGIAARIVVRRAFDEPDHQRDVLGRQRSERASEPELRGRRDAVDRLAAGLPQIDLVEVGLEDRLLVEPRLDDDRVRSLVDFALQAAFVGQEQATHELLGQRAAALAHLAFARIDPHRTQDAHEVHAVVALETTILDRLQSAHQQWRHLGGTHKLALFLARAVQGRDPRRIERGRFQRLAA